LWVKYENFNQHSFVYFLGAGSNAFGSSFSPSHAMFLKNPTTTSNLEFTVYSNGAFSSLTINNGWYV
jgi:hypothetical protein